MILGDLRGSMKSQGVFKWKKETEEETESVADVTVGQNDAV